MAFAAESPDMDLSPHTGLNRDGWIETGRFLLDGVLGNLPDENQPVLMPGDVDAGTFPDGCVDLEALARTFLLAAPLTLLLHPIRPIEAGDLEVVSELALHDYAPSGAPGGAQLTLRDGSEYRTGFGRIEDRLTQ
jgi:hypothetical protein